MMMGSPVLAPVFPSPPLLPVNHLVTDETVIIAVNYCRPQSSQVKGLVSEDSAEGTVISNSGSHISVCATLLLARGSKVYVKYTSICIANRIGSKIIFTQSASDALRHGSHSFTCKLHHASLYSQPQNITALWLVLILPSHGG